MNDERRNQPRQVFQRWRDCARAGLARLHLIVVAQAVRNYILHQSGNQAGSIAFSWLLSMFPLLILLSTSAAYVGRPGDAASLVSRVVGYAPSLVRDALEPVIAQVLGRRNEALLALGLFVTVWTASSGMQAVRTALNRAYGVERGLSFWQARIKVTVLTITVGAGVLAAFSSVVVMPYVFEALNRADATRETLVWLHFGVRYAAAFLTLALLYAVLYGWLPDVRPHWRSVVPGALLGAALWIVAAALLSYTLRTAGKLLLVYGSLAGIVATMVFLYVSAATLIFGAEVNGVLRASGTAESPSRRR